MHDIDRKLRGNSILSSKSLTFRVFDETDRVSELRSDGQIASIILGVWVVLVLLVPILASHAPQGLFALPGGFHTRSVGYRWPHHLSESKAPTCN